MKIMVFDDTTWSPDEFEALLHRAAHLLGRFDVDTGSITGHAHQLAPYGGLWPETHQRLHPGPRPPQGRVTINFASTTPDSELLAVADELAQLRPSSIAYLLRDHVNLDRGTTSAQPLCRIGFVRAADGLDRDSFFRYWTQHHAPLVAQHHPGFYRYESNMICDPRINIDGIVEQWFDNLAECHEHDRQLREEKPDVLADVPRFVAQAEQYIATPLY